jgi:hypothetical protein
MKATAVLFPAAYRTGQRVAAIGLNVLTIGVA